VASRSTRHRFDPVSFVLGSVAVVTGLIVLAGGSLVDDAAVLLPAGLIALGVAILLRVGTRRVAPEPANVPVRPAGSAGGTPAGADLYDLLVPDPAETFLAEMRNAERGSAGPAAPAPGAGADPAAAQPDTVDTGDAEPEPDPAGPPDTGDTADTEPEPDPAGPPDTGDTADTADTEPEPDPAGPPDTGDTADTEPDHGRPDDGADR
jgi:hypothetical protein